MAISPPRRPGREPDIRQRRHIERQIRLELLDRLDPPALEHHPPPPIRLGDDRLQIRRIHDPRLHPRRRLDRQPRPLHRNPAPEIERIAHPRLGDGTVPIVRDHILHHRPHPDPRQGSAQHPVIAENIERLIQPRRLDNRLAIKHMRRAVAETTRASIVGRSCTHGDHGACTCPIAVTAASSTIRYINRHFVCDRPFASKEWSRSSSSTTTRRIPRRHPLRRRQQSLRLDRESGLIPRQSRRRSEQREEGEENSK